ncbi:arsenate reductase ArsC [Pyrinomonas methylaliphatogenes]|uniref:Protein tyrosine phosphatase n=1 Tax=Pyrinomonas methylaliphatogenes TaxID=454194 RepID=A0A0B6WZ79_9BACT|nr:arsenate reductase ArsC [Pyrinomonas methylaliphatogenes]CDM66027.1 protein tyrosine phosphatase [Pyrinomonas methylaliphatogenes]
MSGERTKRRVLFLCTGNSARSQMAEGWLRALGGDAYEVASAGTHPSSVHPLAIEVMRERGIDLSAHRSKSVEDFADAEFDLVITVCDVARDSCPLFPGKRGLHWNLTDPAAVEGDESTRLEIFRQVSDEIERRVRDLIAREGKVYPAS